MSLEGDPRTDDARRREDAAVRLEQKFADFLIAYENDKVETKDWRTKYDERLKPLEDMKLLFERPAKVMGIVLLLMLTPLLGVFGWSIFKWTVHAVGWMIDHTSLP